MFKAIQETKLFDKGI